MRKFISVVILAAFSFSSCDEMSNNNQVDFFSFGEESSSQIDEGDDESSQHVESIRMKEEGGVHIIPAKVNGVPMDFILDTGASLVSISIVEADFLAKSGTLTKSDVIGIENFVLANGAVESGYVIHLKSIQIGSRVINDVEATIDPNQSAPLLLGQSLLERFGKVSIDYKNGVIEFE